MSVQSVADAVIILWGWRRWAAACFAGAISALAFAPVHAFPVLWLTLPVLVWLVDGAAARSAEGRWWAKMRAPAAVGWWFGFGFFVAGLWWIAMALVTVGGALAWLSPLAVAGLAAGLALYWGLGTGVAALAWTDGPMRIVAMTVALSVTEWLRGHVFTGLPWNAFGYAIAPNPVMMQSASLVGLWGLTSAAFLVFAAPAALAVADRDNRRSAVAFLSVALVVMAAHVGFGFARLAMTEVAEDTSGTPIRIVQPMIAQEDRWRIEAAGDVMSGYVGLSRQGGWPGDAPSAVLIWPESAFPFLLTENPQALRMIADLLPPSVTLVTGAARAERQSSETGAFTAFNSAYVIDHRGEIVGAYDKVHLVPFGEYVPLRGLLERLGVTQLVAIPGGFAAGSRRRNLELPDGTRIAPLICYEAIFPGEVIGDDPRPHWLVNLTNDGWFGHTSGPFQHLHMARLRAVEQGLPLVRAANTGISAIFDSFGREVAGTEFGETAVLDGEMPPPIAPTIFARFGDALFLALVVVGTLLVVAARGRSRTKI